MKLKTISTLCALSMAPAIGLAQGNQNEGSVHVMLPESGAGAATLTSGDLQLTDDHGGALRFGVFAPLRTTETGLVFFDVGVAASFDEDFDVTGVSAKAGIVYRFHHTDDQIFGVNAYIEGARVDGSSDTFGLFSLGAEYEYRPQDENYFIQSGGNFYIPFDDYTDDTEYGFLSAAPRMGGDAYVGIGRDYDDYSLLGSLDVFSYKGTDTAQSLSGGTLKGEIAYRGDLPEGMVTRFSLGLTDDNRAGTDPTMIVGLGVDYTFGRSGRAAPKLDCRVVPDATGPERVDCSDPVTVADATPVTSKTGTPLSMATVATPQRATRVTPPRRHLGYGTMMTPIERVAGNGPGAPGGPEQQTLIINFTINQPTWAATNLNPVPADFTTDVTSPADTQDFTVPELNGPAQTFTFTQTFSVDAGLASVVVSRTGNFLMGTSSFSCDAPVTNLLFGSGGFDANVDVAPTATVTCDAVGYYSQP